MAGRRLQRTETVAAPLALLSELRPARAALLQAHAHLRPAGETYGAVSIVVDAIHALAAHLGHPDHFLDPPHSTPAPRHRGADREPST